MATVAVLILHVFTHFLVLSSAENCPAFSCNKVIDKLSFPFKNKTQNFPECGYYTVDCSDRPAPPKIQLKEGGYWFQFKSIAQSGTVLINDSKLQERIKNLETNDCHDDIFSDLSPPSSSPIVNISAHNLTLFRCNNTLDNTPSDDPYYACRNENYTYYTVSYDGLDCSAIHIPILPPSPSSVYNLSALTAKFPLQVQFTKECTQCYTIGGKCFDYYGKFKCDRGECWDDEKGVYKCEKAGDQICRLKLGLGVAAGVVALVVVYYCCYVWEKKRQDRQNVEAFLRNYVPLQVKGYSYLNVKKMTNSFKEKLGQGGYGGVYKGKLNDGCLVAVKVLNRSKGNGEEFMNEVAAISRTSHVNIVSLLGFCFEGSKRALIYEFMPNGSLEKFIFDANNPQKVHHLGWEALERISLGIARGLEYLHRGCNTRILHFDIKPHNILLDENFLPKISDFGLAKICDRKESIVSMLYARGTAGYIAPEVFCRSFGGVSHKSDVYSYGMMLSEMAGGRRNINVEAENTSEIYFPHWIYKRLELDEELGLHGIKSEEDKARARKLIIVSLWCIQTDPSNRPAMKEVIEMLEGSVESLKIPPKPYLSSPAKSPAVADSSCTLVSIQ
uniref:glycerophosphodiester phosphodiesterase protein kinase domain-containing GDPDL2-like n=1 Tax=Fragaria vesca subsp. vesca TaxID=101020 RepID=UPI0005C8B85E|nr:PREDICTED: glycerophosphodiester phosphodiesterase protein kinase domain-containing GDPDL2-like [Fragaria vesca subsp. vesca]